MRDGTLEWKGCETLYGRLLNVVGLSFLTNLAIKGGLLVCRQRTVVGVAEGRKTDVCPLRRRHSRCYDERWHRNGDIW